MMKKVKGIKLNICTNCIEFVMKYFTANGGPYNSKAHWIDRAIAKDGLIEISKNFR